MNPWLEFIGLQLAIWTTIMAIAWGVSGKTWSLRTRLIFYTMVTLLVAFIVWSFAWETVLPNLRTHRYRSLLFAMAQIATLLLGTGLALYGSIQFKRAFLGFRETEYPKKSERIRAGTTRAQRFRQALDVGESVARLPGLNLVVLGVGIAILNNLFEVGLTPDRTAIAVGGVLTVLGVWMTWRASTRNGP